MSSRNYRNRFRAWHGVMQPNEKESQLPLAKASFLKFDNVFHKFNLVIAPASG
jgi:hypothetical protein